MPSAVPPSSVTLPRSTRIPSPSTRLSALTSTTPSPSAPAPATLGAIHTLALETHDYKTLFFLQRFAGARINGMWHMTMAEAREFRMREESKEFHRLMKRGTEDVRKILEEREVGRVKVETEMEEKGGEEKEEEEGYRGYNVTFKRRKGGRYS